MLKIENLDRLDEVGNLLLNPSVVKVDLIMEEEKAPGETYVGKTVMPPAKVFATLDGKVERREAGCASTVERSGERLCEAVGLKVKPKGEEKKLSESRGEKIAL